MKAYHTLDIPFALDNIDLAGSMTGAGNDRYALAHRMSAACASFSRSGNRTTPTCRTGRHSPRPIARR